MSAGGTLRLFHCRPAAPAFDEAMRSTIVPRLIDLPGLEQLWAARQGPDETGLRVIASVWAPDSSDHEPRDTSTHAGDPEDHPGAGSRQLETFPVVWSFVEGGSSGVRILRVSSGVLRELDVERYATDVVEGLEDDRRAGHGPHALVVARSGERGFVTVSAWSDWADIEVATGATIRDPIRTRRRTDLTSFNAEHYELLASSGSRRG